MKSSATLGAKAGAPARSDSRNLSQPKSGVDIDIGRVLGRSQCA
jgi:hypothetical protein